MYKINDKEFIKIVFNSKNIREALLKMNLSPKGGSYIVFKDRCRKLNININEIFKNPKESITDEQILELLKNNSCHAALKKLNLNPNGFNLKWIKRKANISSKSKARKSIPLDEILIENSSFRCNRSLKDKLVQSNLLEKKCYSCGLVDWMGKSISLHLEHKNGINNDNRIENLCFLCPNCHSQTSTYCGKNKKSF